MASPASLDDILSRYGLKRKDLEQKCPTRVRLEMAQLLDDWQMMGYYLGFNAQKLNDIKLDYVNEERRRVALLDAWEQKEGEEATYLKLAEALDNRRRADLVEKLICSMITRRDSGASETQTSNSDKATPAAGVSGML